MESLCGVSHCLPFPRSSNALIFGTPHHYLPNWSNAVLEGIQFPFEKIVDMFKWLGSLHPRMRWIAVAPKLISVFPMVLYVACRIISVVLTFTGLHAPPSGCTKPPHGLHSFPISGRILRLYISGLFYFSALCGGMRVNLRYSLALASTPAGVAVCVTLQQRLPSFRCGVNLYRICSTCDDDGT